MERAPGQRVHVAAAALVNGRGEVLVALRHDGQHQGGLWEFPGGKLEAGESPARGLERELAEELGIRTRAMRPLIQVRHDYPDRRVLLDVWRVDAWDGEPRGREGQVVEWVAVEALPARPFPAADRPVLSALRLPPIYLITPQPGADDGAFLAALARCLAAGIRLVQLRIKGPSLQRHEALVRRAAALCTEHHATLLLNADPQQARRLGAAGAHLDARRLMGLRERPAAHPFSLAASCHDARELAQASRLGLDFAVLSPVKRTPSHPAAAPLGWDAFGELVAAATLPVFALGGLTAADLRAAWGAGAQGIAAIRGLWEQPESPPVRAVTVRGT